MIITIAFRSKLRLKVLKIVQFSLAVLEPEAIKRSNLNFVSLLVSTLQFLK